MLYTNKIQSYYIDLSAKLNLYIYTEGGVTLKIITKHIKILLIISLLCLSVGNLIYVYYSYLEQTNALEQRVPEYLLKHLTASIHPELSHFSHNFTEDSLDQQGYLTVATYNIHHGRNQQGKRDLQSTIDVIKEFEADIIALQEVERLSLRSGFQDQYRQLATQLNMHGAFIPAIQLPGLYYGNAVLSRYPIIAEDTLYLESQRERRAAQIVAIELQQEQIVYVVNTHLGLNRQEREEHLQLLYGLIHQLDAPIILMGDLNTTPEQGEYLQVWGQSLRKSNEGRVLHTFSSKEWQIDYIFHSEHFEVLDTWTLKRPTSDHYPLISKLRIKDTKKLEE